MRKVERTAAAKSLKPLMPTSKMADWPLLRAVNDAIAADDEHTKRVSTSATKARLLINNMSRRHRSSELRPLIDFVLSAVALAGVTVRLEIYDSAESGWTTGGEARNLNSNFISVALFLSRGLKFPYRRDYLTPVRLDTWEEEFLFVLAHEFRHVQQFAERIWTPERREEMEIDADHAGVRVLDKYRRQTRSEAASPLSVLLHGHKLVATRSPNGWSISYLAYPDIPFHRPLPTLGAAVEAAAALLSHDDEYEREVL